MDNYGAAAHADETTIGRCRTTLPTVGRDASCHNISDLTVLGEQWASGCDALSKFSLNIPSVMGHITNPIEIAIVIKNESECTQGTTFQRFTRTGWFPCSRITLQAYRSAGQICAKHSFNILCLGIIRV